MTEGNATQGKKYKADKGASGKVKKTSLLYAP